MSGVLLYEMTLLQGCKVKPFKMNEYLGVNKYIVCCLLLCPNYVVYCVSIAMQCVSSNI